MEHKLILGGEQFLPLARSRIKALRATGLQHASQQLEIDGVSVKVRIAGEHEFIRIEGGSTGKYLITPNSTASPGGDTSEDRRPEAELILKAGPSIKVIEHTPKLAGRCDWKNWKEGKKSRTLSFGGPGMERYPLYTHLPLHAKGIFYKNELFQTEHTVAGAAIFSDIVNGSSIERFVYITADGEESVVAYCSKIKTPPTWEMIGVLNTSGVTISPSLGGTKPVVRITPWHFSPDGKLFSSLLAESTAYGGSGTEKLVVRGQVSATYNAVTSEYVLAATFTVGEKVGKTKQTESINPRSQPQSYDPGKAGELPKKFTNVDSSHADDHEPFSVTATHYDTLIETEEALGTDYLPDGREVIICSVIRHLYSAQVEWQREEHYGYEYGADPNLNGNSSTESSASVHEEFEHKYLTRSVGGDVEIFGMEAKNTYSLSSTYTSVNFVITFPPTPLPDRSYIGVRVHALDGRDGSGIFEYFKETSKGGSTTLYPFNVSTSAVPLPEAPTYHIEHGIKAAYKWAVVDEHVIHDIANAPMSMGYDTPHDTHKWTVWAKDFYYGWGVSMASANKGEFVYSVNLPTTAFADLVQEPYGTDSYTGAPIYAYPPAMRASFTSVPYYSTVAYRANKADLTKIPFFGEPGFNIHEVRLL